MSVLFVKWFLKKLFHGRDKQRENVGQKIPFSFFLYDAKELNVRWWQWLPTITKLVVFFFHKGEEETRKKKELAIFCVVCNEGKMKMKNTTRQRRRQ